MRHHHVQLRRHQHGQRDAVALDGVEGGIGIEPGMQHHRAAGLQRGRGLVVEPADMEQGQGGEDHVVARQFVHVGAVGGIAVDRALGQHHALGLAGGARGVADQQRRIGADLRVARRLAPGAAAELRPADPSRADGTEADQCGRGQCVAEGVDLSDILWLDEEQCRRTVFQHLAVLGAGQAPVERHEHGAEAGAGEQQGQHFRAVESEVGDAAAALYAGGGEGRREPFDQGRKCRAGNVPTGKTNRRLVGGQRGIALDPVGYAHVAISRRTLPAPPTSRYRPRRSR